MGFAQGKGWIKFNPFLGVAFGKAYTAPLDEPRPAITEAKRSDNCCATLPAMTDGKGISLARRSPC
jgi:hypothetical protein